jgi:complement component 1 Q subcomponent-binding protein
LSDINSRLVDTELAARLDSEIALEEDSKNPLDLPETLDAYLQNGPFELTDNAGTEEVTLSRNFGDEHIKITFSISDLSNLEEEEDDFEDGRTLFDDEEGAGDVLDPSRQSKNIDAAANNAATPASPASKTASGEESLTEEDELDSDLDAPSFPARLSISIAKAASPSKLQIEAVVQDGLVMIQNVLHLDVDEKTAPLDTEETPYTGPPFNNLDEDLQLLLEKYLDERGINTELALFVPDYIDWKEQREYVTWLKSTSNLPLPLYLTVTAILTQFLLQMSRTSLKPKLALEQGLVLTY